MTLHVRLALEALDVGIRTENNALLGAGYD